MVCAGSSPAGVFLYRHSLTDRAEGFYPSGTGSIPVADTVAIEQRLVRQIVNLYTRVRLPLVTP